MVRTILCKPIHARACSTPIIQHDARLCLIKRQPNLPFRAGDLPELLSGGRKGKADKAVRLSKFRSIDAQAAFRIPAQHKLAAFLRILCII